MKKMVPDVYAIGTYYPEYYHMGGGYGNLLSYGSFNNYKNLGTSMWTLLFIQMARQLPLILLS